jgi:hypothetical protein
LGEIDSGSKPFRSGQRRGGGEDVVGGEGDVLDAEPKLSAMKRPASVRGSPPRSA